MVRIETRRGYPPPEVRLIGPNAANPRRRQPRCHQQQEHSSKSSHAAEHAARCKPSTTLLHNLSPPLDNDRRPRRYGALGASKAGLTPDSRSETMLSRYRTGHGGQKHAVGK